jgi:hypothetical protein
VPSLKRCCRVASRESLVAPSGAIGFTDDAVGSAF